VSFARWTLIAVAGMALVLGCVRRYGPRPAPAPVDDLVAAQSHRQDPAARPAPRPRKLPPLRSEPRLRVLVAHARRCRVQLLAPAEGGDRRWPAVALDVGVRDGRLVVGGRDAGRDTVLEFAAAGRANFRVEPGGGRRRFAGNCHLAVVDGKVAVMEVLPLERFLAGTLVKEVGDRWPLEALKAQAVAARSYAASQYLAHHDASWHLQATEVVDMAYAGHVGDVHARLRTALEQTRGDLLLYGGLPLPAFFHSCSGGRTESMANIWPERRSADGVTDPSPVMPSVADPWADDGARIYASPTVYRWRAEVSLAEVAAAVGANRVRVEEVRIDRRFADSGRVAELLVVLADGKPRRIAGHDLRMATNPREVRSTLWDSCRVSGRRLVIEGRGFGHGVGMSQVSALAMARDGSLAPAILTHFYPGAKLARRW